MASTSEGVGWTRTLTSDLFFSEVCPPPWRVRVPEVVSRCVWTNFSVRLRRLMMKKAAAKTPRRRIAATATMPPIAPLERPPPPLSPVDGLDVAVVLATVVGKNFMTAPSTLVSAAAAVATDGVVTERLVTVTADPPSVVV